MNTIAQIPASKKCRSRNVFHVDGKRFEAKVAKASVILIRVYCTDQGRGYQMFLEAGGDGPDKLLSNDAEEIKLAGIKIYTVPFAGGG